MDNVIDTTVSKEPHPITGNIVVANIAFVHGTGTRSGPTHPSLLSHALAALQGPGQGLYC